MKIQEIEDQINALSIEERIEIINNVLEALNPTNPSIENTWKNEAQNRLKEIKSGSKEAIPGEKVLEKINKTYFL